MENMVQISKQMLIDIYSAIGGYWAYLVSDARRAKHFNDPESENYYRTAAKEIESLTCEIARMLNAKEG